MGLTPHARLNTSLFLEATMLALLLLTLPAVERDWSIEIVGKGQAVTVSPLSEAEALAWRTTPPKEPASVLALYTAKGELAMLGTWKVEGRKLVFVPRFPLVPGLAYRAVLNPANLPAFPATKAEPITKTIQLPKPPRGPATVIEQVYPTAEVVPENLLKLYVHFSAPMSRGDIYRHIHLLDANGKEVAYPFLEIAEELWTGDSRRVTVFFDPGRIKRGLRPREEDGPILEEGKKFTLVIDADWRDGKGEPLKESFRRTFKVVAPDDAQPDMAKWTIATPKAWTKDAMTVTFPESLDHALLQRLLWIEDASGKRVAGKVATGPQEKTWSWTPASPWAGGEYRLMADKRLEDLGGNSLGKPFELDLFKPVQREIVADKASRGFRVK